MNFGILSKMESLIAQQKYVSLRTNHPGVQLPYPSKCICEGIMIKFPEWILDAVDTHAEKLDVKRTVNSRFLIITNENKGARVQIMRDHVTSKMEKDITRRIGNDPSDFEAKSTYSSVKTQNSEASISVEGLKTVVYLKGETAAIKCMEHVSKTCNDRMSMMDR